MTTSAASGGRIVGTRFGASRPIAPRSAGRIVEIPQLNGLHHRYDRAA